MSNTANFLFKNKPEIMWNHSLDYAEKGLIECEPNEHYISECCVCIYADDKSKNLIQYLKEYLFIGEYEGAYYWITMQEVAPFYMTHRDSSAFAERLTSALEEFNLDVKIDYSREMGGI